MLNLKFQYLLAALKSIGMASLLLAVLFGYCSCAHKGPQIASFEQTVRFEAPIEAHSVVMDGRPAMQRPPLKLAADTEKGPISEPKDGAVAGQKVLAQTEAAGEEEAFAEDDQFDEDEEDFWDDEEEALVEVADPFSGLNRVTFAFNDFLYFGVLHPFTSAYRAVVPSTIRLGVKNFFYNLGFPLRFINCLLQGKGQSADNEFVRFVMNSTVGVLGFGNPAKNYPELETDAEDLGQTFGKWGIGNGFYIVLPILGPSTLRDAVGLVGERLAGPVNPVANVEPLELSLAVSGYSRINNLSFHLGDYESLKDAALDPYEAFRDAYIQYRKGKVDQ
jgi:phospholipid-binding lipoprotein MlaA